MMCVSGRQIDAPILHGPDARSPAFSDHNAGFSDHSASFPDHSASFPDHSASFVAHALAHAIRGSTTGWPRGIAARRSGGVSVSLACTLAIIASCVLVLPSLSGGSEAHALSRAVGSHAAGSPGRTAPKAKKKYTTHIDKKTRKRLRYHTLAVPNLKKKFKYMVYLPKGGIKPGRRYPILVLLHGLGEFPHGWITLGKVHELIDSLVASGKMPQPILLLASGRNGYWTNWADGRHPYGDLVVRSYLEDMRKRYPITDRADLTAVVGCSMGGFGALSLGLRNPETFGFVAALSPTDMEVALRMQPKRPVYRKLVGPPPFDRAVRRINPRHLVERGFGSPRQNFLLVYGGREGPKFGPGTQRVADQMRLRGLNAEVMRVEGEGHGWRNAWARSHPWWIQRLAATWRKALLRD